MSESHLFFHPPVKTVLGVVQSQKERAVVAGLLLASSIEVDCIRRYSLLRRLHIHIHTSSGAHYSPKGWAALQLLSFSLAAGARALLAPRGREKI